MKFTEINAIFTAKVAEYIAKGYVFSTYTMAGHQGEIGKVDLRNENEIVRINLQSNHNFEDHLYADQVILTVGRTTDPDTLKAAETRKVTLWTERLEQVEAPRVFWKMDRRHRNDWYIEGEEGKQAIKKGNLRWQSEPDPHPAKDYRGEGFDKIAEIILPAVRRHMGKPKLKVNRINYISRKWREDHYEYTVITVAGNQVTLR